MFYIMKNSLLIFIIILLFLFNSLLPVNADTDFELYINDFYTKQEIASKLLRQIEKDLKDGSRERVCARQKKAASYGIEATKSLIKAFEINGSQSQIDSIKAGLNKWRELRDYC